MWGNKLDLSLSLGEVNTNNSKFLFDTSGLNNDLLADDSEKVWTAISNPNAASTTVGKCCKVRIGIVEIECYSFRCCI